MKRLMMGAAVGLLSLLSACDDARDWMGFVYTDQARQTEGTSLGRFASFAQCKAAAISALRMMPDQTRGGFECGFKCQEQAGGDSPGVCEEKRS